MKSSRVFREQPFMWSSKTPLRFLRREYKKDKVTYRKLKLVYLSLCEIASDFKEKPLRGFTATVSTYAGINRRLVGKCLAILTKDKLISCKQVRNEQGEFGGATEFYLK